MAAPTWFLIMNYALWLEPKSLILSIALYIPEALQNKGQVDYEL